jgi:molybdenum cofactor guanylyltransferase
VLVTGIILTGGNSSRMGQDKGLVELGGKTLTEIAIHNLSGLCNRILISANTGSYLQFGPEVVRDVYQGIGPMGGLYSCLRRIKTDYCLVLSVDLPFVNRGLLEYLLNQAKDVQVSVPWSGGEHYEPLCACYHISILPLIENFIDKGNYKLADMFKIASIKPLLIHQDLPFFHPKLFFNVNSMDDLRSAENMINLIGKD